MRLRRFDNNTADLTIFNSWDIIISCLIIVIFASAAWSITQMNLPLEKIQSQVISLDISYLPLYTFRSIIRMLLGLILSLWFTLTFGTWAARSFRAERIIIPLIDICQSVPILGFLTLFSWGLLMLFPGSVLGAECAAIFAIFTSQVWNMTLSFYQSLKSMPEEYNELCSIYHLTPWQKFLRVEIPHAMPSLSMNMMLSLSASWFFVVASEVINFQVYSIKLPGIGSYIQQADDAGNLYAIGYALMAMLFAIILSNQLIFNPIFHWISRYQSQPGQEYRSWLVTACSKTKWVKSLFQSLNKIYISILNKQPKKQPNKINDSKFKPDVINRIWVFIEITLVTILGSLTIYGFIFYTNINEVVTVFYFGFLTLIRIITMLSISILIWVPIGVWIGLKKQAPKICLPVIQVLAAFPVNLIYPLMTLLIIKYQLDPEIWVSPLIILGTQWYILFNVIAGTMSIPKDLKIATQSLQLTTLSKWQSLILPAIAPDLLTGIITAAGGAWNASIVAEYITWNGKTILATGIGSYITEATYNNAYNFQALGIIVMCIYVVAINRLFWAPLYQYTQNRFKI
ncbi:MAG: ABC transporter permease subunit [Gammaproteobacteria bacterium]|nr:ABC transporter permease subunit [Gammaproteobacteria bacterium]